VITHRIARWALGFLLVANWASAADITGIWAGQQQGRNGQLDDVAFRFKLDGQTLTGTMFGDEFDLPIEAGTISGDQVRFTVTTTNYYNKNTTTFIYTGTIKGGELELVRERVATPQDTPAANRQQPGKLTLKLKRL
jgi:hypothetical protein